MFCPQCGAEYREGFYTCAVCDVPLVAERSPQPPPQPILRPIDLVTVLATGDESLVVMAKSLLESAGIQYLVKGEIVQDFIGFGRLGTGFNPITGPLEIQVEREHEEEARRLLAEMEEHYTGDIQSPEDDPD